MLIFSGCDRESIYAPEELSWKRSALCELAQSIYRSTDSGASWTKTTTGLSHQYVRNLAIDHEGYILTGTGSDGVYRSSMTVDELVQGF